MDDEGSLAVESSLVFPLVIFFVVMIISISIFVYKNVASRLRFSNEVQSQTESIEDVDEEDELILENKMLFKNTWDALYQKGTETVEKVKKKIKHVSIINTINDTDYALEKAGKILRGESIWMKSDLSLHI
ncbi:MAG: pilus assembly protein [Clostridia bacterium]|nr:pilus assembly protein [Clostridia bacterium]